ncbi:unnamed protein product, partial [Rodentolepis nana]|uniref:DUF4537 domain-containing protein n=1 Tax=Rodentolepis nana TaxID=102285 RepID=A0A0R3T361_RODNA
FLGFSPNTPVNQFPVSPSIPYFYGHPLAHPQLTIPPQNSFSFLSHPQTAATFISQNIPADVHNSVQTFPVPAENGENGRNSLGSDIITNLKEWAIIDFEGNGTFRIAGTHLESGQLHSSGNIVFVNNQGNLVSDGQQTFLLHGPIAWGLYEVQFSVAKINPNPQLKQAFSNGLPKTDRKRWVSKLFNFLEEISGKASVFQNAVVGSQMSSSPLSPIRRNSENSFNGRLVNDILYVDEAETVPSVTMLEEEESSVSSDKSEESRAESRRTRFGRRPYPKFVSVGVQTLPQKPPERPKTVSRSTSTRNERETSPISDWMLRGCRLDKVFQTAYSDEANHFRSTGSSLIADEAGPSSSSRLSNHPPNEASNSKSSRQASHIYHCEMKEYESSCSPKFTEFFSHLSAGSPWKSPKQLPSSSTEGTSKKKFSKVFHSRSSKSTTPVSNSSSSISNISCAYLKETLPRCNQVEITKKMKAFSNLDEKHTLITQNGIVDVRDLKRTRSGRLSIPTRGILHRQKIVCNGNDISVSHGEFGKYFSSQLDN